MRLLALLLFAGSSVAATLPCTVTIDAAGNLSGSCASGAIVPPKPIDQPPNPYSPPPAPAPTPAGTCPAVTQPMVMQPICAGGSNNYVFDSSNYRNDCRYGMPGATYPMDTIQVFALPQTWGDGVSVTTAGIAFTSTAGVNLGGAEYEVSLSRCKGDFSYYKSQAASVPYFGTTFYPCGIVSGSDLQLGFANDGAGPTTCHIPVGEQWYMNWRVVPGTCPRDKGTTCGQTFYIPRG